MKTKNAIFSHQFFKADGYPRLVVPDRPNGTINFRIRGHFDTGDLVTLLSENLPSAG